MNGRRLLMWALLVFASLPLTASAQPWTAAPMDWPFWRGPEQNGISREKNLTDSIDPRGDSLAWANPELGSRSTPIVMDGKLYVIKNDFQGTERELEKVVCADAETGEIIWENKFNVFLSDVPNTRVGWSSVVGDPATGNVFALGVCGLMRCIDPDGNTLWEHSLAEEYGLLSTYGGRTNFPIVYEDLVVISAVIIGWGDMAKPAHRFIAFDKRNGQPVWFEGTRLLPYDTTYSTPVITRLNGQTAMVFGSGDGGVHAFQIKTGKSIWTYNVSKRGINTTPVITDNGVVVCGHSEENIDSTTIGALFALNGNKTGNITETGEIWRKQGWTVGKTAPLIVDGRVYSIGDYGNLRVNDLETGQEIYSMKIGTQGRSSPLYADGKIYVCEANGRGFVLRPTADGLEEIEKFRLRREEVHGSPIASHGRVYVPTTQNMYCFVKKDAQLSVDPRPEPPPEVDDRSEGPAQLQVVPVESLLRPGQSQSLLVRLYSKNGLFIKTVPASEVEFSLEGTGSISPEGKFSTEGATPHSASVITAKYGDLTNTARVRIVPNLPWNIDFSRGNVPVSWVGIRYRNVHIDYDFLQKLQQENPDAAQLYIYLQSDMVNSGSDSVSYDNATPRQTLNALYIFRGIDDKVTNIDEAQEFLNPGLDKLVEEKFLSSYEWKTEPGKGIVFTAKRGEREDTGNIVMMKITTIPKGTRSQGWMGHTDFENYTIQADVMGAEKDGKLPDAGVIAQRYRLEMLGASQELKLYSWIAHEEKYIKKAFPWKADVWYTIKLSASHEERDGESVAILKGKVWPRDEEEPEEWTITWEDVPANETGSPGLFGNATDAEVFYDNIIVTPNTK
ncbi:MAG: PQQ-like beta-propeller repeat protein [Planctomycetaceae bacterium]|nr:PQQ-like beta-propeller repeat protein [Planctomycetaceae bacterium]